MKKVLSIILCMSLCILYDLQVSAAEVLPKEDFVKKDEGSITSASNYYSKALPELRSANGTSSRVVTFSLGSISGSMQVTSISLNVRLLGDPCILYIQAPDGTVYSFVITKNENIILDNFNGCDPSGSWKIWIETKGTVSTISGSIKVYYSY